MQLNFDHEQVEELRDIYLELVEDNQSTSIPLWDLSILSLREVNKCFDAFYAFVRHQIIVLGQKVLDLPESNDQKQAYMQKINVAVNAMAFARNSPCESKFYNAWYGADVWFCRTDVRI